MKKIVLTKQQIRKLKQLSIDSAKKRNLPNGAILVDDKNQIVSFSQSLVASNTDATAHAERLVIEKYCKKVKSPIVKNIKLITVIESCLMCLSACYWAGIDEVYYILPASFYWEKIPWLIESKQIDKQKLINQFEPPVKLFWLKDLVDEFKPIFEEYVKNVISRG